MSNRSEQGFVLPYVLVVIAVLAITTTIAAERLQRSTTLLSKMQDQRRIEKLLVTAEAEVIYALLTGITVEDGIDLNPDSQIETDFGVFDSRGEFNPSAPKPGDIKRDLWSAKGGMRVSTPQDGPVYIELRDVSGLVSLSSGNEDDIVSILGVLGIGKEKARELTAKLIDYTDADNNRQFKGGERVDYRLRNKAPPTNSPLRNYDELAHVLGWEDALKEMDNLRFKQLTSLEPIGKIRQGFAPPELVRLLKLDHQKDVAVSFDFDEIDAMSPIPSGTSRLTFWVRNQDGGYQKRAIEITRTANHIEKPFRRFWVYETTALENALELELNSVNEIKNVIHAASIRLP